MEPTGEEFGAGPAARPQPEEAARNRAEHEYRRFRDPPALIDRLGRAGAVAAILAYKGWCKGDVLRSWVAECLQEAGVEAFADLPLEDPGAASDLRDDPDRRFRFVAFAGAGGLTYKIANSDNSERPSDRPVPSMAGDT